MSVDRGTIRSESAGFVTRPEFGWFIQPCVESGFVLDLLLKLVKVILPIVPRSCIFRPNFFLNCLWSDTFKFIQPESDVVFSGRLCRRGFLRNADLPIWRLQALQKDVAIDPGAAPAPNRRL